MRFLSYAATFLPLFAGVYASLATFDPNNPDGVGCVDPVGIKKCAADQRLSFIDCGTRCNSTQSLNRQTYQDCILSCGTTQAGANIGCWVQSCWNQVYSCEYQLTAAAFLSATDMPKTFIPFYPPPEGGGGACSCNLGHVYGNLTYVDITGGKCMPAVQSLDRKLLDDCQCCDHSLIVSNVIMTCPTSDLTLVGIQRLLQISRDQSSDSTDQCAVISSNPSLCTETFGFDYVNDTVLNPFNLPAGKPGTEPISNLPGNAFTEVGADKITMSVFGYTTTITLAKWNTNAGAVTGTSRGGAAATGTAGSGSGTQTSTAAGAGKTNAAAVLGAQRVLVGGVVAGIVGLGML